MRAGRQHESVSGHAKRDFVIPFADTPMSGAGIEMCEQPRIGCDRHATRLAGTQLNALEAEEAKTFLASRFRQINLRYIGTFARSGIGYLEGCGDGFAAGDSKIAVGKSRVAEPMAESIKRSCPRFGKPAIADLGTFMIAHGQGGA